MNDKFLSCDLKPYPEESGIYNVGLIKRKSWVSTWPKPLASQPSSESYFISLYYNIRQTYMYVSILFHKDKKLVYISCSACQWELILHKCLCTVVILLLKMSWSSSFSFLCFIQIASDYQTHHRLRESQGRDMAEYLNERTQWWSIGEACLILSVGICQVVVLRRFFAEKRSTI